MAIKIIKTVVAYSIIILIPLLGNVNMFASPQIWILLIIGNLGSLFQPTYHILKHKATLSQDHGTEIQIIWSVYFVLLLTVLEASYLRYPESIKWNALTTVALIAMLFGLVLRTWAIYTLGRYFTMYISVQDEHKIIRSGPYKFIRHPSYAGAYLTYLGAPIFLHAWFALLVGAIILPIAWLRRIYYEETLLIDTFGEEYRSYCRSVKRVIPGLW